MKQKIEVKLTFSDTGAELTLMNVYQKGNMLIAVSQIRNKDFSADAICVRRDSVFVDVNTENLLPVKHYIINSAGRKLKLANNYNEVKSADKIREIDGLEALPLERVDRNRLAGTVAGSGLFSDSDDELELTHLQGMNHPSLTF